VIKKPRGRGSHSPSYDAETEKKINIVIIIIIIIIIALIHPSVMVNFFSSTSKSSIAFKIIQN
jgi:flagellar basal body-associated protein FliL